MARMHARKRGKASSTRAYRDQAPEWMAIEKKEIAKKVEELKRQGLSTKLSAVVEELNLQPKYPEDLTNLVRKAMHLRKHLEENKKDLHSKRGLQLIEAKIRRLVKYYKKKGKFPIDGKYDPKTAGLLL
ncbi:MAG: 30S ribosomal protein S15 [Candidatus Heimdallarchaeaceae archaeon]